MIHLILETLEDHRKIHGNIALTTDDLIILLNNCVQSLEDKEKDLNELSDDPLIFEQ